MFDETLHPLYGKDTTCHKCKGVAVWVFNGAAVGNYHYCRACKIETGPFAKDVKLPTLEIAANGAAQKRKGSAFFTSDDLDDLFQQLTFDVRTDFGQLAMPFDTEWTGPDLTGDEC